MRPSECAENMASTDISSAVFGLDAARDCMRGRPCGVREVPEE